MSRTWDVILVNYPGSPGKVNLTLPKSVDSLSCNNSYEDNKVKFAIYPTFIGSPNVRRTIYFREKGQEPPKNAVLQESVKLEIHQKTIEVYLDIQK